MLLLQGREEWLSSIEAFVYDPHQGPAAQRVRLRALTKALRACLAKLSSGGSRLVAVQPGVRKLMQRAWALFFLTAG